MEIVKTSIEGLVLIKPKVFEDDRGHFIEYYKESFFKDHFTGIHFIQDNESKSSYGVLRGLHFQKPPFEQTKLFRVVYGETLDVAVDLRKNSVTYGKWESFVISSENKRQILIPKGFAHGFVVKSKEAIVSYKVDVPYKKDYQSGIRFDDKSLNICWEIDPKNIKLSTKDKNLPYL
jgi:dTDP-4-dehydrorhamnose 3,5-epimerase